MDKYEYLVLVRDQAGRWREHGAAGDTPIDLEAMVGHLLTRGTVQLTDVMLLNAYGRHGWEMVHGEHETGDGLDSIVLRRPSASPTVRRAIPFLVGAVAGGLAVGLMALRNGDHRPA
jgi:hypothetical protein